MIRVQLNRQNFEYDVHSLVKAFYPGEDVLICYTDPGPEEQPQLTVSIAFQGDGERDDRVSNVIFDLIPTTQKNEVKEDNQVKDNPYVLRVFTMISQALVSMKAHLEEGVFRQPGSKQLGIEYKKQIRMVC